MYNISCFVHDNSSTSLFGQLFESIFGIHVFLTEIAIFVFETRMIHCKQFAKYLAFDLLYEIVEGISVNEAAFFCIMSMQIKVKRQSIIFNQVICKLFNGVYGWLMLSIRIRIKSIQVFSKNVHSKMTMKNSIHVYHGNYHKYKHFSKKLSPKIMLIC